MKSTCHRLGLPFVSRVNIASLFFLMLVGCATSSGYPRDALDAFENGNYTAAREAYVSYLNGRADEQWIGLANYDLGRIYFYGLQVEPDPAKAAAYFEKVDGENTPQAKHFLADLYLHGRGVEKNTALAVQLYQDAAYKHASNYSNAIADLAILYWDGRYLAEDRAKTLAIVQKLGTWAPGTSYRSYDIPMEKKIQSLAGFPYFHAQVELNGENLGALTQSSAELMAIPEKEAEAQYQIGLRYLELESFPKHLTRAEDWIKRSARQEFAPAQFLYAKLKFNGQFSSPSAYNYTWIEYLQSAAEQKNTHALRMLATLYASCEQPEILNLKNISDKGLDSWQTYCRKQHYDDESFDGLEKALALLRQATEQGDTSVVREIANLLTYTEFKGAEKQFDWYQWAAEQGYQGANIIIGTLYLNQKQPESDRKAWFWLEQAARQDDRYAIGQVITMRAKGVGVKQSWKEVIFWLKKLDSLGDEGAAFALGNIYLAGQGEMSPNKQQAVYWYEKAVKNGDDRAILALADLYLYPPKGIESNYPEGIKWLQLGAYRGNQTAKHRLADVYMNPKYGKADKKNEALEMYRELVADGDMQAAYHLGTYYRDLGDTAETIHWLKIAAEKEHLYAQVTLANFYEKKDNIYRTVQLREKIAERNIEQADPDEIRIIAFNQYQLAMLLYRRDNHDINKIISLLTRSAESENHYALAFLGLLYYDGKEVRKDQEVAFKWLTKWQQVCDRAIEEAREKSDSPYAELLEERRHANARAQHALDDLAFLELAK